MTKAKDLGLDDIGKLVKFDTHRDPDNDDFHTYTPDSTVIGTLESVVFYELGAMVIVSGKPYRIKNDEEVEVKQPVNSGVYIANVIKEHAEEVLNEVDSRLRDLNKKKNKKDK